MKAIRLAAGLSLPVDVVTQTIAILAKRRAGKSYTMRRIIEQLFTAGQQVVVVDPKGDQWGLRSAADGKAPGLPIVILGGERGDVKLESNSGEVVAKLVVEERVSVLLDLSLFRKHEVATFMTGFLENLYRLKAREIYRTPMMLVIDEADAIAPQKPQKGEERMLGAAEDIVRRGGQRGIGCILVTQRSAVLNKNVLTQAQVLVALRTIAPQDLAALNAWVDVHGTPKQQATLMESLPSLPVGDAWFWSPGWPTVDGIFARVHVLPIETFDSGKSPEPGVKPVEPKNLADVDLNALQRQMAATIEKAKADDPRELRKLVAERDTRIRALEAAAGKPPGNNRVEIREKPLLTDADRALLDKLSSQIQAVADLLGHRSGVFVEQAQKLFAQAFREADALADHHAKQRGLFLDSLDSKGLQKILAKLEGVAVQTIPVRTTPGPGSRPPARATPSPRHPVAASHDGAPLPPGEHATLTAALQYEGLDRKRLSVLTGYKRSSRDAYIARLSAKGLVDVRGQQLYPTAAGRAAMNGSFEALPTGAALIDHWRTRLPEGERKTLEILITQQGGEVDREVIDEATGYKRSSRDAYLVRLKARGLVEFAGRGMVKASAELFD